MKKLLLSFMSCFLLLSAMDSMAQAPQKFNYQGIARDAKGNPMAQQKMSLKISVLPTSDATAAEYEEIQTVNTNEFGLYTLQIGTGTAISGEMKTVKWETGNKYIKVAIDPKGGSDFVDAGTSQLLSVPYAIYADKAGVAKTAGGNERTGGVSSAAGHVVGDANYLTKFTGLNTIGKSQLYENGINIGIGTTAPAARLHLYSNVASAQQYLRMQNGSSLGRGQFVMYNDGALSYSTFSKYGTTYAGGYTGIPTLYPYANLLAFGNNGLAANDGLGRFLISSGGSVGISMFKDGTSKLKFHADFASENVGIGGNSAPVSRVHLNNTDGTSMDLRLTNNTSGHTATDGMTITENGLNAGITNKENGKLTFGTNNTDRVTITDSGRVGIGTATPLSQMTVIGMPGAPTIPGAASSAAFLELTTGSEGVSIGKQQASPFNAWIQTGWYGSAIDPLTLNPLGGNVGIGTSAPTTKLDVAGQIRMQGGVPGAGKVMTSDATGLASWQTPAATGIAGSGTLNYVPKFTPNGTALGNSSIFDNGSIGIGTTAPTAKLDVRNNAGAYILANFSNTSTSGDRSALLSIQSGNATGSKQWLMGVGGTSNGMGITNNQYYVEHVNKGVRMLIDSNGNMGIGTKLPSATLTVNSAITVGSTSINSVEGGRLNFSETINSYSDTTYCGIGLHYNGSTNLLKMQGLCGVGPKDDIISFNRDNQKVVIGTVASTPGNYKLYVEDGILTERLKVAVNGSGSWADYVFADEYNLLPLEEVESFIKENKHLPNVPSAQTMAETGIDVATVDAKLMEKIEELTLYMIEMKKEIKSLKSDNENMKANLKK